jgi:DNA repair exonuclease SbcCD ATPase subunit
MSNEVTRTADQVAADINKVKLNLAVAVVVSSIEIGRLLLEAKALVPHGEWGAWLAANVDFSESKAQSLMRRYKEFGDGQIDMITGTSDLDFFAFLSDSQMDALLALPKPERREFVEEHREELESGEMSVRKMQAEIARLKKENEAQADELAKANSFIEVLEGDLEETREALNKELDKPSPEPLEEVVVTHQPSTEQIDKIRAEVEAKLEAEHREGVESIQNIFREKIKDLEKERDEALEKAAKKAKSVNDLMSEKEKIKADHKAALDKLNAEHEKKLAELEASYKKQAKATAGADPNVMRIQLALEDFKRTVTVVSATLEKMKAEGGEAAQKADKLQANVEKILANLIAEAGWTV